MVQRFGESDPRRAAFGLVRGRQIAAARWRGKVRTHSWIVAAEGLAKMTMAGHVVGLDTDAAVVQSRRDIASE